MDPTAFASRADVIKTADPRVTGELHQPTVSRRGRETSLLADQLVSVPTGEEADPARLTQSPTADPHRQDSGKTEYRFLLVVSAWRVLLSVESYSSSLAQGWAANMFRSVVNRHCNPDRSLHEPADRRICCTHPTFAQAQEKQSTADFRAVASIT